MIRPLRLRNTSGQSVGRRQRTRRSKQAVPLRPYPRGHFPTFGTAASSPTIPATKERRADCAERRQCHHGPFADSAHRAKLSQPSWHRRWAISAPTSALIATGQDGHASRGEHWHVALRPRPHAPSGLEPHAAGFSMIKFPSSSTLSPVFLASSSTEGCQSTFPASGPPTTAIKSASGASVRLLKPR